LYHTFNTVSPDKGEILSLRGEMAENKVVVNFHKNTQK
jgi:hypothetical protein